MAQKPARTPARNPKSSVTTKGSGQIRIIGGIWRSRKLPVAEQPGLRPTTDRVKETLFNWLQFELRDARVLDAFAGSGSLGFEALSRGASELVMIEQTPHIARQLQSNIDTLGVNANAQVICANALSAISANLGTFQVIFLDPPFQQGLLQPCITQLEQAQCISENGWVYIECERDLPVTTPPHWQLHREKYAGQVAYRLYQLRDKP